MLKGHLFFFYLNNHYILYECEKMHQERIFLWCQISLETVDATLFSIPSLINSCLMPYMLRKSHLKKALTSNNKTKDDNLGQI